MDNFQQSLKNTFVAQPLDRSNNQRKDQDWIIRRMSAPGSRFVPIRQSKPLIAESETPGPVFLTLDQLNGQAGNDCTYYLGEREGCAYFVVDLDENAAGSFEGIGRFQDLRTVASLLSREDGAILAYAKALTYWHRRSLFCGACGSRNETRDGGNSRACMNPRCGELYFPRTDPAMIVLVTSGDRCLLGRQRVWPENMYSVLAGFVEPGESAEGAVAREVLEEVGLRVNAIHYQSSQPWPFPCSLMLGFTAEAVDRKICLGDMELQDARWFERRELYDAVNAGDITLPRSISIAYRLIEDWFDSEGPLRLRDFAGPGSIVLRND